MYEVRVCRNVSAYVGVCRRMSNRVWKSLEVCPIMSKCVGNC